MKRKIGLIGIVLVILVFIIVRLCSNKRDINERSKVVTGPSKVAVSTDTVKKETLSEQLELLGTLIPGKDALILSEADGRIIRLYFEKGDVKQKGEVLAQIENETGRAAVERSRVALEKAAKDVERFEILYKGGAATKRQLEEARIALKSAQTNLRQDQKLLSNSTITAPFTGTIMEYFVEAGTTVAPGSQIAHIADVSTLKVNLSVPEQEAYQLKPGDSVAVSTSIYPGVLFGGTVAFVSPVGDQTHNYRVEVNLQNRNDYPLKAGTYVTTHFGTLDTIQALVIPREALIGSTEQPQVYVVENGVARLRNIQLGQSFNERLGVREGLHEGEQVVVTGLINLKDNTPVEVIR